MLFLIFLGLEYVTQIHSAAYTVGNVSYSMLTNLFVNATFLRFNVSQFFLEVFFTHMSDTI